MSRKIKKKNYPVAEANRGGSCLHVICRYEKKLFADIEITQSRRLASATLFIFFLFRDTATANANYLKCRSYVIYGLVSFAKIFTLASILANRVFNT